MKMTYPFRRILQKADPRLAAIYRLEEISRACAARANSARPEAGGC